MASDYGSQASLGVQRSQMEGNRKERLSGTTEGGGKQDRQGAGRSAHQQLSAIELLRHAQLRPGSLLLLLLTVQSISCWGQMEGPETTRQGRWSRPGRERAAQLCPAPHSLQEEDSLS